MNEFGLFLFSECCEDRIFPFLTLSYASSQRFLAVIGLAFSFCAGVVSCFQSKKGFWCRSEGPGFYMSKFKAARSLL